jgi:TPP-dependent pyruvate/acetoin dehydrogenase alpha subunit
MTTRTKQQLAVASTPKGKKSFSLISDEKLISLYAAMLKARLFDERAKGLFARVKFPGASVSATGREAAIVGVALDLLPEDVIGPSPLGVIAAFVKGASLKELLGQLIAGADNARRTRDMGYGALIAAGAAMVNKSQDNKKIAVSFLSGPSTAPWLDALGFAGVHKLPILFVSWVSARAGLNGLKTENLGIPCIAVDGSDVVAVYRVACEAIVHARKGNGPTLIECATHHLRGRSPIAAAKRRKLEKSSGTPSDPILNMENYLAGKGLFHKKIKTGIVGNFSNDLDAAIDAVRKASRSANKRPKQK